MLLDESDLFKIFKGTSFRREQKYVANKEQ